MTMRVVFCLIFSFFCEVMAVWAQSDAFDEKIRDATNGLNRYERLQRTEKLLAENEASMSQIQSTLKNHEEKLKSLDDLKRQLESQSRSIADTKNIVDDLKKSQTETGKLSSVGQNPAAGTRGATASSGGSQSEVVAGLLNDINVLKDENSKQLELNRKLRLDLESARLELRELSKMVSELNSKVK